MKRLALSAITIAMLILTACPKVNPEGPKEMVLETTEFTLPAEGGKVELKFTPLSSWTALSEDKWLDYSPEAGEASSDEVVLVIKAEENSGEERKATLVLSFETNDIAITITQEEAEQGKVDIKETEFTVPAEGDEIDIKFAAPTDWTTSCKAKWVTIDPESGKASTKKKTMTIKVAENDTYEQRTAVVYLEFDEEDVEITITQEAKKKAQVALDKTEFSVSEEGGEINVEFVPLTDWKAISSDTFISFEPTEGKMSEEKVTVKVTVLPNLDEGSQKREAIIKFQFEHNEVVVTITQDGAGPKVNLNNTEFNAVSWKGESVYVHFSPEVATAWSTKSSNGFIECIPKSGNADAKVDCAVELKVAENTETRSRTATVMFYFDNNSVEVTVTQEARPADVIVDPQDISVPASGGDYEIRFTPTTAWTLTCSDDFISCDRTSGAASSKTVTVIVSVEANPTTSFRGGYVELSCETNDMRVSINQDAASGGTDPDPDPDPDENPTGGTEDVNKGDDVTIK